MVAGISQGEGAGGVHRTGEHIPCMEGALVQVHRGGRSFRVERILCLRHLPQRVVQH